MRIDVNQKYCITADADQLTVNEKSTVKKEGSKNFGDETLRPLGYFSKLSHCYEFLLHRQIRESQATSFKELTEDVNRIEKELKESIKI